MALREVADADADDREVVFVVVVSPKVSPAAFETP